MNTLRFVALSSLVLLAPACSKKAADAPPADPAKAQAGQAPAAAGDDSPGHAPGTPEPARPEGCPAELSGTESQDRTIRKECGAVKVAGDYEVNGGTLTLEAGAKLAFEPGASLQVGYSAPSKLVVKGTAAEPVVFASAGDQEAGVWRGVTLYDNADRSTVEGLEIAHAGTDDNGALFLSAGVEGIRVVNVTFRDVRGPAIRVDLDAKPAEIGACNFADAGTPMAMNLGPTAVQGVKPGHTFAEDAYIRVQGGALTGEHTWGNPGVPLLLTGTVEVQGQDGASAKLTLAPGTVVKVGADAGLDVGYGGSGQLVAVGSAEAPVVFTSGTDEAAGAWGGLRVYGSGAAQLQHVRFQWAGGGDDDAALVVTGKARLEDVTFSDCKQGVKLDVTQAKLEAFERNTFQRVPTAVSLFALQLGQLGAGNVYDEGARIDVSASDVGSSATWRAQRPAVVTFVEGETGVTDGATLTVEAGSAFAMGEGVVLGAGYGGAAVLKLEGTAEAPITFRGLRAEPGAWGGLHLYGQTRGAVLRHVKLSHVGEAGGVQVDDEAEVTLEHVACSACGGPTVAHGCTAKVTATEVTAGTEGQVAVKKAEGCE